LVGDVCGGRHRHLTAGGSRPAPLQPRRKGKTKNVRNPSVTLRALDGQQTIGPLSGTFCMLPTGEKKRKRERKKGKKRKKMPPQAAQPPEAAALCATERRRENSDGAARFLGDFWTLLCNCFLRFFQKRRCIAASLLCGACAAQGRKEEHPVAALAPPPKEGKRYFSKIVVSFRRHSHQRRPAAAQVRTKKTGKDGVFFDLFLEWAAAFQTQEKKTGKLRRNE
jgi:hypothetical protein